MGETTATLGQALRTLRTRLLPVRRGDLSFVAFSLAVVFGSLFGIVVLQTFIVQNRVELDQVNRELDIARDENQRLRLTVLDMEAPGRVQDVALGRLGMIRPIERQYLPGIDPMTVRVATPGSENPFGPAPLPDELRVRFFGSTDDADQVDGETEDHEASP